MKRQERQKGKKKHLLFIGAALLALSLFFISPQGNVTAAAAVPKPTASYSSKGLLRLLKKYNKDVYRIMNTEMNTYHQDPAFWWLGSGTLIEGLDTGVHETYHGYTWDTVNTWGMVENIYAGGNKSYRVNFSGANLFKTYEMAKHIPSRLRTFRYGTYVGPNADTDANTKGVFGLINEFSAYYWGLNAMSSLTGYYKKYDTTGTALKAFTLSLGNNMTAYAEFKYWILRYVDYARSKHPAVYKAILKNKNFCRAYRAIETKFAKLINSDKKKISSLNKAYSSRGYSISLSADRIVFRRESSGSGLELDDYNKLMKELKKSKYRKLDSLLKSKAK